MLGAVAVLIGCLMVRTHELEQPAELIDVALKGAAEGASAAPSEPAAADPTAAADPVPAPPSVDAPACKKCGAETAFIEMHQRYRCTKCRLYQ